MTKKPRKTEEAPSDELADAAESMEAATTDATPDANPSDHTDGDGIAPDQAADATSSVEAVPEGDVVAAPEGEEIAQTGSDVAGALPSQDAPQAETPVVAAPPPSASGGAGAGAMIFGGLVAGAIGFAAAWFLPQAEVAPGIDPVLEDRVAALEAEVAGVETPAPFDPSGIEARQGDAESRIDALAATLEDRLGEVAARIDTLTAKVEEIAARPVFEAGDTEAAMNEQIAAFEQIVADAGARARAELDTLREEAEAIRAEAEAMQEEAIAATETADRRAALASIQAAIDSGEPFEDAVGALGDAPAPLADLAGSGVPTLSELRQGFPDAARAALAAADSAASTEEAGRMSRLTSFLRRQTNARSLAPKEGGSVDAILSRAEAALNSGDLDTALAELDTLPPASGEAMSGWLQDARTRAGAVAAAQELVEG